MYQLQLTGGASSAQLWLYFSKQIYIKNHPIEWQLQVDLWLKNGKSKD